MRKSVGQRIKSKRKQRINNANLDSFNMCRITTARSVLVRANIPKLDSKRNKIVAPKCKTLNDNKSLNRVRKSRQNDNNYLKGITEDIPKDSEKTLPYKNPSLRKNSLKKQSLNRIKRKCINQCKPFKNIKELEKSERLFIRLVKLDISANLNAPIENNESVVTCIDLTTSEETTKNSQLLFQQKIETLSKKTLKTEMHRNKSAKINTTESLKLEQKLIQKFKKVKENRKPDDCGTDDTDILEPYLYEKTNKSLFETYERTEDEAGQMLLRCLLCPYTGEKFKQMSLHYKFKHRDTPIEEMYFCDIKGCSFKAVHKGLFKWHMKRHLLASDKIISDSYPCHQCNRVFEHRKGFLIHLKHMHQDPTETPKPNLFACSTCKFTTTTMPNLQAHVYRKHIPNDIKPNFKCNVCGYETHYRDSFKKHLTRVHLQIGKGCRTKKSIE